MSASNPETPDPARLAVIGGVVQVVDGAPDAPAAQLSWPPEQVRVLVAGCAIDDAASCDVAALDTLHVEAVDVPARVEYLVSISRDRMEATLRVVPERGLRRTLVDAAPTSELFLRVREERIPAGAPDRSDAVAAIQAAGVVSGIDQSGIDAALAAPGTSVLVAAGTAPVEGTNGRLEALVDFAALRRTGVLDGTPLVRRIPKRDGMAGRDVTGRDLAVPTVTDARLRPGEGVLLDGTGLVAVAAVDGAPSLDDVDGRVEVRHELVLPRVDTTSGDIEFNGSVRVLGDVEDGRRVRARDEIVVDGNVDRASLDSGGSIRVEGTIMSSQLRAGGDRAVAVLVADHVLELPRALALVAMQARQFRDQGEERGTPLSHGLSIQLVLERMHRGVLASLTAIVAALRDAGPTRDEQAERAARWHRQLSTAANSALTVEQFQAIVGEVAELAEQVHRAIEQPADLVVSYMQASDATAAGTVTVTGKGIFNSRVVAWGGLVSQQYDAVLRGGSVTCHGDVRIREIGSPAGATTLLQLGSGATVEADRTYAGTVFTGPGYTHRFVADRTCISVDFDAAGSMNVVSLAA